MTEDTIIRELGGGAVSVLVIFMLGALGVLSIVIRSMWARITYLQDRIFTIQEQANRELSEMQRASNTALNAVQGSLASIMTLISNNRGNRP
jgi:hypothetical protein